jgi:hypothetical protein
VKSEVLIVVSRLYMDIRRLFQAVFAAVKDSFHCLSSTLFLRCAILLNYTVFRNKSGEQQACKSLQ